MKVAVYAIAKDEAKFAARWMCSMQEADAVYVLDTGSSDRTPGILRSMGAEVKVREYDSFRFDVARNDSMDMVPPGFDVLVCTDLDEFFLPGWRAALERAWRPGATVCEYEYVWGFNPDGTDARRFLYRKVHAHGVCRWTHPVHEVLSFSVPEVVVRAAMRLEHHADPRKSREQYLGLLEESVRESPGDDRNLHYLGREYMFRGMWADAERTLRAHLACPSATWDAERAQSMRFIARCRRALGDGDGAELWYRRAVDECPALREPAVELAQFAYDSGPRWRVVEAACRAALRVRRPAESYLVESESWGPRPHDLLALALWYTGRPREARAEALAAARLAPGDRRLRSNALLMGVPRCTLPPDMV